MSSIDIEKAEKERNMGIAIKRLWAWQYANTNSFFSMLFTMLQKADQENTYKIWSVYPNEVEALIAWRACPDQDEFFRMHGLHRDDKS